MRGRRAAGRLRGDGMDTKRGCRVSGGGRRAVEPRGAAGTQYGTYPTGAIAVTGSGGQMAADAGAQVRPGEVRPGRPRVSGLRCLPEVAAGFARLGAADVPGITMVTDDDR